MPLIDRTKLNALLGNLLPSFVAESKKMKDAILVLHDTLDVNWGDYAAFKAGGAITDSAPGMILYHTTNTPPSGWLKANGAAVSRTTYSNLFAAVGTTFGVGDSTTTFNLPDLRGEFMRGWDDGRGVDTGRVFGSAQAGALESHAHSIGNPGAVGTAGSGQGATVSAATTGGTGSYATTLNVGGTETRPRNIALLACIKY